MRLILQTILCFGALTLLVVLCSENIVPKMTYYVSCGMLNTYLLTNKSETG